MGDEIYKNEDAVATFDNEDTHSQFSGNDTLDVTDDGNAVSLEIRNNVEAQRALWKELNEAGGSGKALWPIVQFTSLIYYCYENEPTLLLDVTRIGNLSELSEVKFTTRDSTAKAGVHFHATSGVISFKPGETSGEIRVPLESSDRWDTTLEFIVELLHDDLKNAIPGRYLWQARVKVIQVKTGTFPTDKFSVSVLKGRLEEVPKHALFAEYCKMSFLEPVIKSGVLKMLGMSLVQSIYVCFALAASAYLLICVIAPDATVEAGRVPEDRTRRAWLLVLAIIGPYPIMQGLDIKKLGLTIADTARGTIQKNLLRKFLNYRQHDRSEVRETELILAMTRDAHELVDGFMQLPVLGHAILRFFFIFLCPIILPIAVGEATRFEIVMPVLALPIMLVLMTIACRKRNTIFVLTQGAMLDRLCHHVGDTTSNYPLIADYNQRPIFADLHEKKIEDLGTAMRMTSQASSRQNSLIVLLVSALVLVQSMLRGLEVIDKKLHAGHLLLDLVVTFSAGSSITQAHWSMCEIHNSFPSLVRLTRLLNLKIDLPQRMQVNRTRRDMTKELRAKLFTERAQGTAKDVDSPPLDLIPVKVTNIDFTHLTFRLNQNKSEENLLAPVKFAGSLEIEQGKFVVLVGPQGEGKSTLLRLIGDMIVQDTAKNNVFLPSHLRLLHVCHEPLFFHGTLLTNMTFGVRFGDSDGRPQRVSKILKRLGLAGPILEVLESDEICKWGEVLSETQRTLLNLGRALVANPEVLCVHKPTDIFDKETTEAVLTLLKEFVTERGIEEEPATKHLRRPRTCIITSSKDRSMELADKILYVSSETGVLEVTRDQLEKTA